MEKYPIYNIDITTVVSIEFKEFKNISPQITIKLKDNSTLIVTGDNAKEGELLIVYNNLKHLFFN